MLLQKKKKNRSKKGRNGTCFIPAVVSINFMKLVLYRINRKLIKVLKSIYLKELYGEKNEKEGSREKGSCICWSIFQMAVTAITEPHWSLELHPGLCFLCLLLPPMHISRKLDQKRSSWFWNTASMACKHSRQHLNKFSYLL